MRAGRRPVRCHEVFFGDDQIDREPQIGEGSEKQFQRSKNSSNPVVSPPMPQ